MRWEASSVGSGGELVDMNAPGSRDVD